MRKIVIILCFIVGLISGWCIHEYHVSHQNAYYESAAQVMTQSLADEHFFKELADYITESYPDFNDFLMALYKDTGIAQDHIKKMSECLHDYQELLKQCTSLDARALKKAFKGISWHIVDGSLKMVNPSYVQAAKSFAYQGLYNAYAVKSAVALDVKWHDFLMTTVTAIKKSIDNKSFKVLLAGLNCTMRCKIKLRKYPRLYACFYAVQETTRYPHESLLFLMALKDKLIENMEEWFPIMMPHAQRGLEQLQGYASTLIKKENNLVSLA